MRRQWSVLLVAILTSVATAAEPQIELAHLNARQQIQSQQPQQPLTADDLADVLFEIRLLKNEISDLVKVTREYDTAIKSLQNRAYALENPGRSYPQQAKSTPKKSEPVKLVRSYRATYEGTAKSSGPYIFRHYSDGTKTRQYYPLRRSVTTSVPTVRYTPTYQPIMTQGWGGGFGGMMMGGCAGGS